MSSPEADSMRCRPIDRLQGHHYIDMSLTCSGQKDGSTVRFRHLKGTRDEVSAEAICVPRWKTKTDTDT
jgi:hypothetical protein